MFPILINHIFSTTGRLRLVEAVEYNFAMRTRVALSNIGTLHHFAIFGMYGLNTSHLNQIPGKESGPSFPEIRLLEIFPSSRMPEDVQGKPKTKFF